MSTDPSALLRDSELYKEMQARMAARRPQMAAAEEAIYEEPKTTAGQAIATSLIGVLPLILGYALAKKKNLGLAAGAEAGATGAGMLLNQQALENERRAGQATAQYKALSEEQRADREALLALDKAGLEQGMRDQSARDLQKIRQQDKIDLKQRFPNKGITINNIAPNEPLPVEDRRKITEMLGSIQGIKDVIATVEQKYPQMLREKPVLNPDGSIDWDATEVLATRAGKDWALGANTESGRAMAMIEGELAKYVKMMSGTQSSDPEYQRLARIITGKGHLIPATWPVVVKLLKRHQAALENQASSYLEDSYGLAGKDPQGSFRQILGRAGKVIEVGESPPSPTDVSSESNEDLLKKYKGAR